jgi:hypothetical protein
MTLLLDIADKLFKNGWTENWSKKSKNKSKQIEEKKNYKQGTSWDRSAIKPRWTMRVLTKDYV